MNALLLVDIRHILAGLLANHGDAIGVFGADAARLGLALVCVGERKSMHEKR